MADCSLVCGDYVEMAPYSGPMSDALDPAAISDAEWRDRLSPDQYSVLRQGATEPAFAGAYNDTEVAGMYRCSGCRAELFDSGTKFHSGSGWPSFWAAAKVGAIEERSDVSHGMVRTEILCAACGGHLGHVFPDGPGPTGLRYCVNSLSLDLDPADS